MVAEVVPERNGERGHGDKSGGDRGGGERASRMRQRQRLIDACISALHLYGPSRTTVEKVVSIAGLSPGTVSFYFDSKAAMLIAALEFLANEFEQLLLLPVAQIKDDPVRALELLVDLYLDPAVASTRKISVWYSFWGEATARKEYHEICGKRDDSFELLVQELIEAVMRKEAVPHLDADAMALGLIGCLEMLWQDFAFQQEEDIDRPAAKRRCLAYLRSIFPRQFGAVGGTETAPTEGPAPLAGRFYADPAQFVRERDALLLPSWQLVGHEAEFASVGDYLALTVAGEGGLVLRAVDDTLRGFRNRCRRRPHELVTGRRGSAGAALRCSVDGSAYGPDGAGLLPLQVAISDGLVYVRLGEGADRPPPSIEGLGVPGSVTDGPEIAADWKLLVELWLDGATGAVIDEAARIVRWPGRAFIFPNLLVERGGGIVQLLPLAAGRTSYRHFRYGTGGEPAPLSRLADIAESTQRGLTAPSYMPPASPPDEAAASFVRWLAPAL